MEFRRYDKINCSFFDLIDGDTEPKQTMALGFLLAKSEPCLKEFLKIIGLKIKYNEYIVDCEAQKKQIGNNDRIDILIRFYFNNTPTQAIIVEAKSIRANVKASVAIQQSVGYTIGFGQLKDFSKQHVTTVALTRDAFLNISSTTKTLSWSHLISCFHSISAKNKTDNEIINNFVKYILNIKGTMKYYEEDVLSIPAGTSIKAVEQTGIYECPISYRSHKKSLYVTFRKSGASKGEMSRLYKLEDIYELDINDAGAIQTVDNAVPGFFRRINLYKQIVSYPATSHDKKQVYVLDLNNTLQLPRPVRPIENNTSPVYYPLCDFFQQPNSNIGAVIVQKHIWVDANDILYVCTNGKKHYRLSYKFGTLIKSFATNGTCILKNNFDYIIDVIGINRSVALKSIDVRFINNKWKYYYIF